MCEKYTQSKTQEPDHWAVAHCMHRLWPPTSPPPPLPFPCPCALPGGPLCLRLGLGHPFLPWPAFGPPRLPLPLPWPLCPPRSLRLRLGLAHFFPFGTATLQFLRGLASACMHFQPPPPTVARRPGISSTGWAA
eukprot:EG_transcript_27559